MGVLAGAVYKATQTDDTWDRLKKKVESLQPVFRQTYDILAQSAEVAGKIVVESINLQMAAWQTLAQYLRIDLTRVMDAFASATLETLFRVEYAIRVVSDNIQNLTKLFKGELKINIAESFPEFKKRRFAELWGDQGVQGRPRQDQAGRVRHQERRSAPRRGTRPCCSGPERRSI